MLTWCFVNLDQTVYLSDNKTWFELYQLVHNNIYFLNVGLILIGVVCGWINIYFYALVILVFIHHLTDLPVLRHHLTNFKQTSVDGRSFWRKCCFLVRRWISSCVLFGWKWQQNWNLLHYLDFLQTAETKGQYVRMLLPQIRLKFPLNARSMKFRKKT